MSLIVRCRKVAVINLDPANDALPYPCHFEPFNDLFSVFFYVSLTIVPRYECVINIEHLIKLSDVMSEHSLGPNGGWSNVQESSVLVLLLCFIAYLSYAVDTVVRACVLHGLLGEEY
jgi:hypothetical protein